MLLVIIDRKLRELETEYRKTINVDRKKAMEIRARMFKLVRLKKNAI